MSTSGAENGVGASRARKSTCTEANNTDKVGVKTISEVTDLQTIESSPSTCEEPMSNKDVIKAAFKKYIKFIGPGLLVSVAYIDPGNYSTATSAGAANQFSLLCGATVQLHCYLLAMLVWANWTVYFFAECAIIATDVAEVIGTAIALNILIKVPLPAGVCITLVDVLAIMATYRPGASSMKVVRMFELFVALLVVGVCICFAVELAYIPKSTSAAKVFRGFVPSRQMLEHNGVYTAISILGATVMPHSLFLGSALVQPRLLEYDVNHGNYSMLKDDEDEKNKETAVDERYQNYRPTRSAIKYCMKFSMIELGLTLFTLALFVNCAILIVAGSTLYGYPDAADADLYTIHDLLSKTLAPIAGTIFMLALLLSGQSAGIVCTMAGQIVCEGHIHWKLKPWQRRLVTRAISLIPCLAISISIGKEALSKALNASQVVLSIVLPFLVAPLIYFTCNKKIMETEITVKDAEEDPSDNDDMQLENGQTRKTVSMANNWVVSIIAFVVWVFLSALNIYAIVQLGITHGEIS
ncbi:Natural resistance-associated macrophage protein [Nakaseomyces glabratus]|nr:Natural resistance-associated macrophage protein [Nakaseomyces glabratus]